MRRGRMFWGVILLFVGGMLLLNNFGLLPVDLGQVLWPSLIILVGLWVLFRGRLGQPELETQELTIASEGAANADLKLHHGVGRVIVGPGANSGEVLNGTFAGGVRQRRSVSGDRIMVDLSVPSDAWMGFPWGSGRGFEWDVHLTEDLLYEISVEAGAGELQMDLENLKVSRLDLKTGASSSLVRLPAGMEQCRVKLDAGVASVQLVLPEQVGARVTADMGLADLKIDPSRFTRTGKEYRTNNYEQAENKIEIDIDAGVSSVEIK